MATILYYPTHSYYFTYCSVIVIIFFIINILWVFVILQVSWDTVQIQVLCGKSWPVVYPWRTLMVGWAAELKLGWNIKLLIEHRNTSCRCTSWHYRAWGIFSWWHMAMVWNGCGEWGATLQCTPASPINSIQGCKWGGGHCVHIGTGMRSETWENKTLLEQISSPYKRQIFISALQKKTDGHIPASKYLSGTAVNI